MKKIILLTTTTLLLFLLTSCSSNVKLEGTWKSINAKPSQLCEFKDGQYKLTLMLSEDEQASYYKEEDYVEEYTYEQEALNSEITKVTVKISDQNAKEFYKYKNLLGDYVKISVPAGNKFDLVIGEESKGFQIILKEDGSYETKYIYSSESFEIFPAGNYYVKKNIIYKDNSKSEENLKDELLYYILDDGLFSPIFKKK